MNRLTGCPASSFDSVFCNDCNRLFKDTGFDQHLDAMQMLMANMMHETCNFIYMQEIASGTPTTTGLISEIAGLTRHPLQGRRRPAANRPLQLPAPSGRH